MYRLDRSVDFRSALEPLIVAGDAALDTRNALLLCRLPASPTVSLPLPGDREITTRAKVRRREPGNIGLEFDQLDWDDMFALARYLNPRLP